MVNAVKVAWNTYRWSLLVWFLVIFGLLLRVYQIDRYPLDLASDGLAYSWAGTQMLENPRTPAGMTLFRDANPNFVWYSHHNYHDTVRRFDFRIVRPFLDQPPFILPIIGFLPRLFGYVGFAPVPEFLIRLPAIFASGATLWLTYLLGKVLFSKKRGLLGLLVLGLTPYAVFAHRESFLENYLTPIYLIGFILLWRYRKNRANHTLFWLGVLSLIAVMSKMVGIVLPTIIIFWLLYDRNYRTSILIGLTSMFGLSLTIGYGLWVDSGQQWWILNQQASRGLYFQSFLDMFLRSEFYTAFQDGWYYLLFVSWFVFVLRQKLSNSDLYLTVNSVFLFLVVILIAGVDNNFFWYIYPTIPLMSLTLAWLIERFIARPTLAYWLLFVGFGWANLHFFSDTQPWLTNTSWLRLVYLGVFFPILLHLLRPIPRIMRALVFAVIGVGILINIFVVAFYPDQLCDATGHCRLPEKMLLDY